MSASSHSAGREAGAGDREHGGREIDAGHRVAALDQVARDGLAGAAAEVEDGRAGGDEGEEGVEPLPLDEAPVAVAVEAGGLRLVDGAQVLSHRSAP